MAKNELYVHILSRPCKCLQENNIHRAHRIRKRSMEQDLRIEVFYHDSVESLSGDKRNIVKEIVSSGQTTRVEYV